MKINIGPYPHRWISHVYTNYMNDKYGFINWPATNSNQPWDEKWREKLEDTIQFVYDYTVNLFIDRREQRRKIRIDRWDTWSMDYTLAHIIVPMLKQLKNSKSGAPWVDMKDVPKELRATEKQIKLYKTNGETDPQFFDRWDWVVSEMIWAFEQKLEDDWHSDYYGPYIESESGKPFGDFEWIDHKGMDTHQERMNNGFRLFGKYYESLWD